MVSPLRRQLPILRHVVTVSPRFSLVEGDRAIALYPFYGAKMKTRLLVIRLLLMILFVGSGVSMSRPPAQANEMPILLLEYYIPYLVTGE